jgi:hypothetical protein
MPVAPAGIETRPVAALVAAALRFAADPGSWPVPPRFEAGRRWYTRLATAGSDGVEVWGLTWLPGQATDLHDHGGSAGVFVVVTGALTEDSVRPSDGRVSVRRLSSGTVRSFGPHHIHRIVNAGPAPAVSVHAYAPALRTMTRYRLTGGGLHVASVDRAGADW